MIFSTSGEANPLISLAPVREQFLVRLYEWSLKDVEREVDENLRSLRKVKGRLATEFVAAAEYMDAAQRVSTFRAYIKHTFAYYMGKKLTSDVEDKLQEDFYLGRREYALDPRLSGYPQRTPKIPRTAFRKLLKKKLADQGFGKFDSWDLPTEWRYKLPVGSWTVETYIDTGARSRQLAFKHNIVKDPEGVSLFDGGVIPLLEILYPTWDVLTPEDLPEAADDLIALCRDFLDAVPGLLEGLEPPKI